jgi:RNA polymerase sigma-70 factor (ECF subfamily)
MTSSATRSPALDPETTDADHRASTTTPDGQVQQLLERGDVAGALRHVMLCFGDSVYRFCCGVLGDSVLAQDVHQQVFMEALRDLPQFQYRSTVRTWIFGIARHRLLDAARARRRSAARIATSAIEDELADEPDPGPAPDESIDATRLQAALADSLRALREPVRVAVVLRFQQGLTFEEIAGVCGDRPGTHHARVTRALRQLRADIESRLQDQPVPANFAASRRARRRASISPRLDRLSNIGEDVAVGVERHASPLRSQGETNAERGFEDWP